MSLRNQSNHIRDQYHQSQLERESSSHHYAPVAFLTPALKSAISTQRHDRHLEASPPKYRDIQHSSRPSLSWTFIPQFTTFISSPLEQDHYNHPVCQNFDAYAIAKENTIQLASAQQILSIHFALPYPNNKAHMTEKLSTCANGIATLQPLAFIQASLLYPNNKSHFSLYSNNHSSSSHNISNPPHYDYDYYSSTVESGSDNGNGHPGHGNAHGGAGGGQDDGWSFWNSRSDWDASRVHLHAEAETGPFSIRVVTYNVLSPPLARPDHFTHCNPDHLNPEARFKKIILKLEQEIIRDSIICLQEVSLAWAGRLHAFFQRNGYHFIHASYGTDFNGYMGVAIAFSCEKYTASDVDLTRLSDSKPWPGPPQPRGFARLWMRLLGEPDISSSSSPNGISDNLKDFQYAKNRRNVLTFARLRCRRTGTIFCVATYHMPCAYWSQKIMVVHTALAVQHIQRLARNDPYVLAGDFNIKPDDSCYKLVVEGKIDSQNQDYPDIPSWDSWRPSISASMKSAYYEVNGQEPEFTNFAKVGENPTFIDTLDYIFISDQWEATQVLPLPRRIDVSGPLPNKEEPSDHLMIGTTLELINARPFSSRKRMQTFEKQTPELSVP